MKKNSKSKHNNYLSKFYIYIVLLSLVLCSCGDLDDNSSVEDAFANQSELFSSENSDLSTEVLNLQIRPILKTIIIQKLHRKKY